MRLKDLPLRFTALTAAGLIALPGALLLLFPRPAASGLDRLLPYAALLQSFVAQPTKAPPALWQQRLGLAEGARLWRGQRRLWWQFWGPHGDAGAYLVFPAAPSQPLPADALRVDDLVVVAPSPLARQLLQEQLKLRRRAPRGLDQRCSLSLLQREAVHWNGVALAQMLGPLSPLALSLQQGCFILRSEGTSLLWQGEADSSVDALQEAPSPLAVPDPLSELPPQALLELRGSRLEVLLRGLLSTALLRDALAQRYGLGAEQVRQLQAAAFVLQLRGESKGPYRAGLDLLVRLPGERRLWDRWLVDLSRSLVDQGLSSAQPGLGITLWSREDGAAVGGWRWLASNQLLLFLGPSPQRVPALAPLSSDRWQLLLQPSTLQTKGLLPEGLPLVVKRAQVLQLQGRGAGQSALAGRLELR